MFSGFIRGALIVGACLFAATVSANTPSDVRDLVGERASSGERALQNRGYYHIDTQKSGGGAYSYWWNPVKEACLSVATRDGRYDTIVSTLPYDCNQYGSHSGQNSGSDDSAGAAAAAIGAAVLIGAIAAAHKSHHHDDRQHRDDHGYEMEFERGHNDGLYNHHYDNYNRSDAYTDGYNSGVEQRDHDTSYRNHSGRYDRGYEPVRVQTSELASLNGLGKRNAHSKMRDWGFERADTIESGSTVYTIWYKRSTGQCMQMTEADDRVYDVRGIGHHPACR